MKLSEVPRTTAQRIVAYGEPKSGKTELAGRLAEAFELDWFDLENGYAPLLKLPMEWQERINLIRIPDTKSYPVAITTMLKVITGAPVSICHAHGTVSCPVCLKDTTAVQNKICLKDNSSNPNRIVVVDSLTGLANSAMNWLTRNQKGGDEYRPEWGDYRNQGTLMDKFLSEVQQSTWNIVCITHVSEVEQEDGKVRLVPVAGTRNFSRNTAKYFDHVVYCQVKNKKHMFGSSTIHDTQALTGSRTDVEIEGMEVPSLLPFFDPVQIADGIKKAQVKNSGDAAKILASLKSTVKELTKT